MIAHEQILAGESGGIPCFAIERGELGQFNLFLRVGLEQDDIAVFRHNKDVTASKQDLAMAVAAILPFAAAVLGVDTGENAIIKAIKMVVIKN